ncbi:MAG: hypothetical protein APF76_02040 [Desulfitibacter sp. BRH_c19]|nr:MAG: hypothetical protein APF76_02040 [Desulfitibacter sp. BRH_c19]
MYNTSQSKNETGIYITENKHFEALFKNASDAIIYFDLENRIVEVNSKFLELFGYSIEEIKGRKIEDILLSDLGDETYSYEYSIAVETSKEILAGKANSFETIRYGKGNIPVNVIVKGVPVIIDDAIIGGYGIYTDITPQKQVESALKESEARYRSFFENASVGIGVSNFAGFIMNANEALCRFLGYSLEELSKIHFTEFTHKADIEKDLALHNSLINGEISSYVMDKRYIRKDGQVVWGRLNISIIREIDGEFKYLTTAIENIDERKCAEVALKESERRLADIIDFLPDPTFVIDKDSKVVLWNRAVEKITGVKAEDMLGKGNYEYSLPFHNSRRPILIDMVLDYDKKMETEYKYIKRFNNDSLIAEVYSPFLGEGGSYLWVKATPLRDIDGSIVGAIESFRDTTERHKSEKELIYQKQCFETLFKNSFEAITLLDRNHRVIDLNSEFQNLFGYCVGDIKGKNIDSLLAPGERITEAKEITNKVCSGQPVSLETIRYSKAGRPINVQIKGVPVTIENEVVGVYGIYDDITERKLHEERLKYLGMHDVLTTLYNRNYFEETLRRIDTERQLPISIIIGDVNGLKLVNDAFGHNEGDKLLKRIAKVFKKICRAEDIVCRLGGDEFAFIFPKTDEYVAEEICNRIKDECHRAGGEPIPLSVAFGVATKKLNTDNMLDTLKEAEERMYRNKLLESKSSRSSIILSLQKTLSEKTHETDQHCQRLKEHAVTIGKAIGLTVSELDELVLLTTLHDVGKVAIPEHILQKPGPLDDEEWEIMKKHTEIGHRIAQAAPELVPIADKILYHHERWDGTGYPHGLRETQIPLASRILAIVDAFDVMTKGRPYKRTLTLNEALIELEECVGTQFDPDLVEVFIKSIEIGFHQ